MDLQTLTYIVVGFTFALYIGIAIWARAGSTKEFYVAGGASTRCQRHGDRGGLDVRGLVHLHGRPDRLHGGYGGSVFLMGWTGGYVCWRCCSRRTCASSASSRCRSSSVTASTPTARIVAVICLIIASVTYVIGQMKGVGVAFSRFLEVDYDTGLYIGMGIVFFYAVLGGMKGITYTQIAQYCVLILAYTIPAIFISLQLTGNPLPQLGLGSTLVGTDVSCWTSSTRWSPTSASSEYTTTCACRA
jgi:cation/acetate symporter